MTSQMQTLTFSHNKISGNLPNQIQLVLGMTWRVITCVCQQPLGLEQPHGTSKLLSCLLHCPLHCLLPDRQSRAPYYCPSSHANHLVHISMSECLHSLSMPEQSSQFIKAILDFAQLWVEGSSSMLCHQSLHAELAMCQSLPGWHGIVQIAQLSSQSTLPPQSSNRSH